MTDLNKSRTWEVWKWIALVYGIWNPPLSSALRWMHLWQQKFIHPKFKPKLRGFTLSKHSRGCWETSIAALDTKVVWQEKLPWNLNFHCCFPWPSTAYCRLWAPVHWVKPQYVDLQKKKGSKWWLNMIWKLRCWWCLAHMDGFVLVGSLTIWGNFCTYEGAQTPKVFSNDPWLNPWLSSGFLWRPSSLEATPTYNWM